MGDSADTLGVRRDRNWGYTDCNKINKERALIGRPPIDFRLVMCQRCAKQFRSQFINGKRIERRCTDCKGREI